MPLVATPTEVVTSIYDAFKSGDIPAILKQVERNATWHESKTLPWGGDYRGPEGAGEFFAKLNEHMNTLSFEVRENIEVGSEVFSFGTYSAQSRKTGKTASADWMFRWHVQDGQITAWESFIDTAALVAAL